MNRPAKTRCTRAPRRAASAHCQNASASEAAMAMSRMAMRASTNQMKLVAMNSANSTVPRAERLAHQNARIAA